MPVSTIGISNATSPLIFTEFIVLWVYSQIVLAQIKVKNIYFSVYIKCFACYIILYAFAVLCKILFRRNRIISNH